jgi:GNAT superfamily N-acetyltransferase
MSSGAGELRPNQTNGRQLCIRGLRTTDLRFADELRSLAGWNQTPKQWELRLRLEPEGCFLAEWDGVPVATTTTTYYGEALAWIGMMLVHPDYRRLGIGAALFRHTVDYLRQKRGVRCIKLDATPLGRPLYERFGFRPELELTRWQRVGAPPADADFDSLRQTAVSPQALDRIVALDALAFGCRRSGLLEACIRESRPAVRMSGQIVPGEGFGLLRGGARAFYLGPVVARHAGVAEQIIRELLGWVTDSAVYWDIFEQNSTAVGLARTLGFTPQRPLVRMFLGSNPGVGETSWQWGILDPATG